VAACVSSLMKNSVSNIMITEFSKRDESYRNWLELPFFWCLYVALFGSRLS